MIYNSVALPYVTGIMNDSDFLGPPIVACMDNAAYDDRRWLDVTAWADSLGELYGRATPVFGIDGSGDFDLLRSALLNMSRFIDVSARRPFVWSDGVNLTEEAPCGMFLSLPSDAGPVLNFRSFAWIAAASGFVRVTANNGYGIGLMAVGPGDPETKATPPVYDVPQTAGRVSFLNTVKEVWVRGGPVALSSYQALQEAEATRFGISRRVHPALVPYILLKAPT